MREANARYFRQNMDRLNRRDRMFINNPVVMQGLGIAPIVIPAISLRNGLILAVAVILLLTPTRMLATLIGQHTGFKFRAVLYVLVSGVVFIGVAYLVDLLFGGQVSNVGIYLALLVVEPLILKRYESPKRERLFTSFKKGIITTVGFCIVLLLVAAIREFLATGQLYGEQVINSTLFPMAAMPAGGFIILGIFVAVWRGLVAVFKQSVGVVEVSEEDD
ncbi:electron transporter RnfE [Ruminococcaceae bacterium OttesenSCG-928-I18]|nr:electron transporter RnfE [Ruminococcaceae bacterium OttesenSCG-928-I18]